ncbi:MAG: HlyD family efflux transporter periplasmic adaptor subunit [Hyphomicrobiales bacterium]|nr:HlyD family efflux transporter periplasmic adaptor subunit [Hyphomicrobiales bacterium]
MPAQRLFQVSSVEAVINARLVTVRSPIDGIVGGGANPLQVGDTVSPGGSLLAIRNERIDRTAINAATDALQRAKDDRGALMIELDGQKKLQRDLQARIGQFRSNRVRLIDAQIREADARLTSALAIVSRAEVNLQRHTTLTGQGYMATSAVDDARRDMDVAQAAANEARARKAALLVEANALRDGHFFGDSYNDEPQSAHRLDEVNQSLSTLNGQIALQDQRIASAYAALQRAQEAFSIASEANLASPVNGQLWEILTAPGEQVVQGQDLARLLDCDEAIVTAAVSESVYNGLTLGMPATFTFSEGGAALPGKVVQLSGVSPASSNFAIMPAALTKESYRVAIAVQGASKDGACAVGRTGRVVFQKPTL